MSKVQTISEIVGRLHQFLMPMVYVERFCLDRWQKDQQPIKVILIYLWIVI